jgi:hypothetical protein
MLETVAGSGSASLATAATSAAAAANLQAQMNNLESYNAFLQPTDPDYDPPKLGDDYETVLIKYNKSYDAATMRGATRDYMNKPSTTLPEQNRRLIGRVLSAPGYRVPDTVLPPGNIPRADRYKSYNFNERQQYLVDYSPVSGPNKDLLVANFCNSLGFEAYSEKLPGCEPGDCCVPMRAAPIYDPAIASAERAAATAAAASASASQEGFASGSERRRKCAGTISLAGRTQTISVPRPPITIENERTLNIYRVEDPARPTPKKCKGSATADDNTPSLDDLYNIVRPAFIKEIQTALKGDKLFDLRCPASCI